MFKSMPTLSAKPAIVAHLDLNSFFASVEQQANPLLRGRPVGVCAYLHPKGCVIAASVEAKKLGMKVGMSMQKAKRVVPGAVFVQNDPPKYRTVGARVFALLAQYAETMERYSIDEAFIDLTGWYASVDDAARAMAQVQQRIRAEIGEWLGCSIGIASTRFLAKTGSDVKKPNGLTIITPQNLEDILGRLDLEAVCGIGPRTRVRLEALGYATLLQVKRAPVVNLMHAFGKRGYFLWCDLNGVEVAGVVGELAAPKSIGHSYCVPRTATARGAIQGILAKLTDKAASRLRKEKLLAGTVSVAVGFFRDGFANPSGPFWKPQQGAGTTVWKRLDEPSDDAFLLIETAIALLHANWHGQVVNFLAVTLGELAEESVTKAQPRLFEPTGAARVSPVRRKRITTALDQVRERHGTEALMPGRLFGVSDEHAQDRIGYRKL
jgi:DNA polymerase IV